MKDFNRTNWGFRCSVVLAALLISGCATPLRPAEFVKALQAKGWTYADFPRASLVPGAIVTVSKDTGLTVRGSLASCGAVMNDFDPALFPVALQGKVKSGVKYGIDVLATVNTVKIGPSLSRARNVTLMLGPTNEYTIDEIKVRNWLADNLNSIDTGCRQVLAEADTYILTSVLGATSYNYSFTTDDKAKISISTAQLSEIVSAGGSGQFGVTQEGDLSSTQLVYFAFKKSLRTNQGPGSDAGKPAEETMRDYNVSRFLIPQ